MTEISIFDGTHPLTITKPVRLIELFAGYGSQRLSLDYLNIPYESYAISEWAIKSIQAYKDMHEPDDHRAYDIVFSDAEIRKQLYGRISRDYSTPMTDAQIDKMSIAEARKIVRNMYATNNKGSITAIKGADIDLEGGYTYILSYSFPCQDLSNAGLRRGMDRDSGTRSGLLWEVERLLREWYQLGRLPDILLMENVPEVVGTKNRAAWEQWIAFLDSLGYHSYWKVMNAVEYGIPQNRRRCFMVSVCGDYYYDFPEPIGCPIKLKDVLEPLDSVSEAYYLSDELIKSFMKWSDRHQEAGDGFCFRPTGRGEAERAWGLSCKAGSRGGDNFIDEGESLCHKVGDLTGMGFERTFESSRRVYADDGACPTIHTSVGRERSHKELKILVEGNRFPSEHECGRVLSPEGAASTVKENHGSLPTVAIQANNSKGYDDMGDGDSLDYRYPSSETRRGRVGHGVSQTIQTDGGEGQAVCIFDVYNHREISKNEAVGTITTNTSVESSGVFAVAESPHYRIRKLTERECFRLMGVKDADSSRVAEHQAKSSMYHLAGDSIVTACLMAIFGEMFGVDWKSCIKKLQEDITNV